MGHPALDFAGGSVELGLTLRLRSLGEFLPVDSTGQQEVSGGPMSWTRLSHLEITGLTPGRSTKTLPATWLQRKGREKQCFLVFGNFSSFTASFQQYRSHLYSFVSFFFLFPFGLPSYVGIFLPFWKSEVFCQCSVGVL